jgi:hypothetical protein
MKTRADLIVNSLTTSRIPFLVLSLNWWHPRLTREPVRQRARQTCEHSWGGSLGVETIRIDFIPLIDYLSAISSSLPGAAVYVRVYVVNSVSDASSFIADSNEA